MRGPVADLASALRCEETFVPVRPFSGPALVVHGQTSCPSPTASLTTGDDVQAQPDSVGERGRPAPRTIVGESWGVGHECGTSSVETGQEPVRGYVALTFDDGPTPETLPSLLDALVTAGARATFFNRGDAAEAHPDLVRAQRDAGMWIGSHTMTHPHLRETGEREAFEEMNRAQQALQRITGEWPPLFRPPFGETDERVGVLAARLGVLEVLWTVDSRDWAGATEDEIVAAARTLRPGGIFLMHDWARASVDALPRIIGELRERGLHPGRIGASPCPVPFGDTPFHATAVAP